MVIFLNSTRGRGDTGTIQSRQEREGGVGTKTQASQLRDEAMRVEREMSISSKSEPRLERGWGGSQVQGLRPRPQRFA